MVSGVVRVITIDEDNQEVVVDAARRGEIFGFASMLAHTPHQTKATAIDETTCVEVDRNDIGVLSSKAARGLDMMTVLGRQFQSAQHLVRIRANRNPNEMIEEEVDFRRAHRRLGGIVRRFVDLHHLIFGWYWSSTPSSTSTSRVGLGSLSVHPPQPLPVHAGRLPGAGDHDEPESYRTRKTGFAANSTSMSIGALTPISRDLLSKLNLLSDKTGRHRRGSTGATPGPRVSSF